MSWIIKPYESVGPINIGQPREVVRQVLGSDYDSFAKVAGARPADAYDSLGVHLYYDDNDLLEFVEMFEPAAVEYNGVLLLGQPFTSVNTELSIEGPATPSNVGYEYDNLGIVLTLADGQVEGVAVYRRGYYG